MTIASNGISSAALKNPGDQRHDDRGDQQVDQRLGELGKELSPGRHRRGGLEPVRAEAGQSGGGFSRAQPSTGVVPSSAATSFASRRHGSRATAAVGSAGPVLAVIGR